MLTSDKNRGKQEKFWSRLEVDARQDFNAAKAELYDKLVPEIGIIFHKLDDVISVEDWHSMPGDTASKVTLIKGDAKFSKTKLKKHFDKFFETLESMNQEEFMMSYGIVQADLSNITGFLQEKVSSKSVVMNFTVKMGGLVAAGLAETQEICYARKLMTRMHDSGLLNSPCKLSPELKNSVETCLSEYDFSSPEMERLSYELGSIRKYFANGQDGAWMLNRIDEDLKSPIKYTSEKKGSDNKSDNKDYLERKVSDAISDVLSICDEEYSNMMKNLELGALRASLKKELPRRFFYSEDQEINSRIINRPFENDVAKLAFCLYLIDLNSVQTSNQLDLEFKFPGIEKMRESYL